MIKSLSLFALLCVLSLYHVHAQDFLPNGNFGNEEWNWENEEWNWEGELIWNTGDGGGVGKATGDTGDSRGNSPEDVGAAVHDAIVKLGDDLNKAAELIPKTGDPDSDQAVEALNNALADFKDDVKKGVDSVGTEAGNVVTNSLNNAQSSGDASAGVTEAVSESLAGIGENADQIGEQIESSISDAITKITETNPNALSNEDLQKVNNAVGQISAVVSGTLKNAAASSDQFASHIGTAVGDAVNQGGSAADVAGNSFANLDQSMKDNASDIVNDIFGEQLSTDPDTQAQIDEQKQSLLNSLEGITEDSIEEDRAGVSHDVNEAISAVEAQGIDPSENPGAVIDTFFEQSFGPNNGGQ